LAIQRVEIDVSLLALDEALYQLLRINYEDQNGAGSWRRDNPLRSNPNICTQFHPELELFVNRLIQLPNVCLIDIPTQSAELLDDLLKCIAAYSLAPRDAFHLAVLKAIGLTMILTNDSDFDRVQDPIYVLHFW